MQMLSQLSYRPAADILPCPDQGVSVASCDSRDNAAMSPAVVTAIPLAAHLSITSLPLVIVALIATVVAAAALGPRLARRLGAAEWVARLLIVGFGFVLSWTLLPSADGLQGLSSDGVCNTDRVGLIPWHELTTLNEHSLNVALFVPLGIAVALLPVTRSTAAVILAAIALTFVVETIQLLVPVLGRGCETADLFDNLLGLVIGIAVGLALRVVWRLPRRAGPDPRDG
jgi:glycopeptide antibiotics resistance protein